MLDVTSDQHQKLLDIAEAIEATRYGRDWPREYSDFFRLWGFFNSIYNILYTDQHESRRVKRFALDNRFSHIWTVLAQHPSVKQLAHQPCVGDGRSGYKPSEDIQVAFHTLRVCFDVNSQVVCQTLKCQSRQQKNISICLIKNWPSPTGDLASPDNAKFVPFGATLMIVYQIRNNLFHGSKTEIAGSEYERNLLLVQLSSQITRLLLGSVDISSKPEQGTGEVKKSKVASG